MNATELKCAKKREKYGVVGQPRCMVLHCIPSSDGCFDGEVPNGRSMGGDGWKVNH